jgi:AraC-like DNA-binding protein
MLKHELRNRINDRATTHYSKGEVTVLKRILDATHVPDWKSSQVENCFSTPMSVTKWSFHTNLERHTVSRAIKKLLQECIICEHPVQKGAYNIMPEALLRLESKYSNSHSREIEQKILNAVRMRLRRRQAREGEDLNPLRFKHPEHKPAMYENEVVMVPACACAAPFCSM